MVISCWKEANTTPRREEQNVVPPPPPPPPTHPPIKTLDLDHCHELTSSSTTHHRPSSSAGQEMSRESRHVRVDGLPQGLAHDRLKDFFSGFGRVQKVIKIGCGAENVDKEAVIVSFMDVRSAQKACSSHSGEAKLDGHLLRIQFHEPTSTTSSASKNSAPSPTLPTTVSQPFGKSTPSELLATEESPRRTKTCGHSRPSSAMSYSNMEDVDEKKRSTASTTTQNDSAANFQTNSSGRSSPSRSSSSPSPTLQHHQKRSVRRKGTTITNESSLDPGRDVSLERKPSSAHLMNSFTEGQGLQGIYVTQLPSSSQIADQLATVVHRHAKLIHIVYEQSAEGKSALVLLQNVSNMEALLTTLNLTQLGGTHLKAQVANHVAVTEAYNNHLAATSAAVAGVCLSKESLSLPPPPAIPSLFGDTTSQTVKANCSGLLTDKKKVISLKTSNINSSTSSALLAGVRSSTPCSSGGGHSTTAPSISSIASYGGMSSSSVTNDPLSKNASRTLYVGNLEKRVTDQCLKNRYGLYGHILEVELKSRDTAAPFAFIQFTNIKSVAAAIGASHPANKSTIGAISGDAQKPVKVGWGKSICSNKLWIGALPKSCSKDYLLSKMRVITPDDVTEVMYDPNHNETLVFFKTNDAAQVVYNKIKNRILTFPPEKLQSHSGNTHVQVDFCSEKLHDFFVDRQFGRFGGTLPTVDGQEEALASNECQTGQQKETEMLLTAQKKAMSVGCIPDTLLLAPPPDPPKNLATELMGRGNEHLGAASNQNERTNLTSLSASNSQQSSLSASIVPPDPAMTSSNSMEKSVVHRHNSSSYRRQPVSSSPDPSCGRVQRHETPSSRYRDGNERERSSDYISSSRIAERDRRSTSHSYPSKRRGEDYRYESSSRHGQLSTSDRTRSTHSSHYSQPTGSSSHNNSSSLTTGSSSQQLHSEYTLSFARRAASRRPGYRSSLSSSSTSSSGSSDSTSDSSQTSSSDAIAGAGKVRPSVTRHSWEHRSRKKERGAEKPSIKRAEAKVNSESNSKTLSSRHQSFKSLQKPSAVSGGSRNSNGREKVFESTKTTDSQSTSKERTETLSAADYHASKPRKSGRSTGNSEKNRHSASPLCPPPPMPSMTSVVNPTPCSKLKKVRRSEKVRDSSSSSSASSSSSVSDSQKQRQNPGSIRESKEPSNINPKKLASVIGSVTKTESSLVSPGSTQESEKLLPTTNVDSESLQQEPPKASISSYALQPEEKLSTSAHLAKSIISSAITGPPLSAPLPANSGSTEWAASRRISHSISSGSSQPAVKCPPRQLLKTLLNIPYSLKTSSEVKDPRTGRLLHLPSTQMSLPLPRFAETSSFRWNREKRSPTNSLSGGAIGLDVVQRSPPMSATVQKSSFSAKFFPGNQQDEKEAEAPIDPKGKEATASICSPTKSLDLEGSARSILGFSPEPEKPVKSKGSDPLAELFKNVAPAAPSSLAKRLTEFRNKYKDVEQKIQETKMNVFAAYSSRKPTSIEQELERLQSRSYTLSGLSLDNQESTDLPKRSLSIHIPSSNNSSSMNKPSSPSSTLQNLKKGLNNICNTLDDHYSTPTSQSSPILAKSEAGDQSLPFPPQPPQLRQSPQLTITATTSSATFRPTPSCVSSPRPISSTGPKAEPKAISSLTRQSGNSRPVVPTTRQLHICMPGNEPDVSIASPSATPKHVVKSLTSSNSTPGSLRTPVSGTVGTSFAGEQTHPLSVSKTSTSAHMPPPKDSTRNNRILDDLFRQQANDTKRVVVNKAEKKSTPGSAFSTEQQHSSSAVKEVPKKTSVVTSTNSSGTSEKEKCSEKHLMKVKRRDERKKEEETKERQSSAEHHAQKHRNENKDSGSGNSLQKYKDKVKEEKQGSSSKPTMEKKEHESKSSQHKHDKPYSKEKERDKEEQRNAAKKIAKTERRRKEEQEEKERQKEKKRKKQQKASQVTQSSESEEEDSDIGSNISLTEFGLAGVDIEEQRRMMKQIKAGNFGMSMYDRVKRRSSAQKPEDQKKKSKALQILREKSGKKKKFNRIQLSSSDDEDENSGDEGKDSREKQSNNDREEEGSETDIPSKTERPLKLKPKRDKEGHNQRSDMESDDGLASVTSQSTTTTAVPPPSSASRKLVAAGDKEECKQKSVESGAQAKKQPTTGRQSNVPETKVAKKVKPKEEATVKEKAATSSSTSKKEREKRCEKSEEKNKKLMALVRNSTSSSSSCSSGSGTDENESDDSSTDGDAYIKKLQKELSKCRSSSPANSPVGSENEVKQRTVKSKPSKLVSSSKDATKSSGSKTTKTSSKKQPQTKKVERLSMEDVYGQESSDEVEDVHNSTSSTVNSAMATAKKESPSEPSKDKTSSSIKQRSKHTMAELFAVSEKSQIKKIVTKKTAEPSSRKSTMDSVEAMFIKQKSKKISVEEKAKTKPAKVEESGPKKKENSQPPTRDTETAKRKKKSSESTHPPSQSVNEPKRRKTEMQEEGKKKVSKKRQASENEPSFVAATTTKRVKTEPSVPSETTALSTEVKPEVVSIKLEAISTNPEVASTKSEVASKKPEVVSIKPEEASTKPDVASIKPMISPTGRKATVKVVKQEPTISISSAQKLPHVLLPQQGTSKEATPPPVIPKDEITSLSVPENREKMDQIPPQVPIKNLDKVVASSSSSSGSSSSSSSSSSSDSNDSSAEEQVTTPLRSRLKVQRSGVSSSSLAQIQSHHRRQFCKTGFHAPTKPQLPVIAPKPEPQLSSPQSTSSQLTSQQLSNAQLTSTQQDSSQISSKQPHSPQLSTSKLTSSQLTSKQLTSPQLSISQLTSPQLSSPQLTSPTSSRPDRLSSIGPSTSLENIAVEDVQKKLVAELAADATSSCSTFEVLDHGTVAATSVEAPPKVITSTSKPIVKPAELPPKPTQARRGRVPNMAAKKLSKTQLKFGMVPAMLPKVEDKKNDSHDFDSDEMEAELLRRMYEEEDMAVMNLTTGDGDDAFGKQQQVVKKEQETKEAVKSLTSMLSPTQINMKKSDAKVGGSSLVPSAPALPEIKLASPAPPPTLSSPKKTDKTAKVEPVERRSSNESMESSHMGSGGGYMEIDAEHLLQQQKEQEELEKKQEQERRKAEELARMEETVEAVIAAATRSSQQQSQSCQPAAPPTTGSDTSSPYQTIQLQSSIDSRTPQSENSHGGGTATPKPTMVNYAPTVIASQGSQQGSPVVVVGPVQVQQPYGSNSSQLYANQQRKSGVIVEEKSGQPQFAHLVQNLSNPGGMSSGGGSSGGIHVVVCSSPSSSSSSHIAQMIQQQQQQQKLMQQQVNLDQRPVGVQKPVVASTAGKRGKQQVPRPQTVLAAPSQQPQCGMQQHHQANPQQQPQQQTVSQQQQHQAISQQQQHHQQPNPQQQQHSAAQQQMSAVQGQAQHPLATAGPGPNYAGLEQQNVNARLLAFYNQLNFMNTPMAAAAQQGQQSQQQQQNGLYVARNMQQQQVPNVSAATTTITASAAPDIPNQLTARHWSSMVNPTVTQPSNTSLINGDPASLEIFRQQHAAQIQALQKQQPNNIGSSQPTTAPGSDVLLQQHLQAQQNRQISAQQQQAQQSQQNYASSPLRTVPQAQVTQQQNRQEVVGQTEQQQRKPSPALMHHQQQQNAAYIAHQQQQQHQNAVPLQQQQQVYPHLQQQQPQQQNLAMVTAQMPQQHNQAEQQQRNTNEKYPVLWQGQLAMKNTDTLVQMHRVCGNDKLIDITNQELVSRANGISTIRITQRMRLEQTQLESLMKKMEKEANYVALVCLPCGRNREDITVQTSRMTTHFIDYFTSKMAAGIVNQGPTTPTPSCVAHVFPPSDFATGHLNRHAPDLLVTIEKHNAGYLFVVITTNN